MQDDVIRQDEGSAVAYLIPAIIGGLIGALIGGAIWGAIAIFTKYQVGYVALLVGFLAGGGVLLLGRKRGVPYQLIAVVMAILGLAIGKYLTYYFLNRADVIEQFGQEAWDAAGLTLTSPQMFEFFFADLGVLFEAIDILFIILAIVTAWGMPSNRVPAAKAVEKPAGT